MTLSTKFPKSYKLETVLTESDRVRLKQTFANARLELLRHNLREEAEMVRRLGESFEGDIEVRNVGESMYD